MARGGVTSIKSCRRERSRVVVCKLRGLVDGFRDALEDCHLLDLGFKGPTFTWSNNRKHPHTVRCQLDRFCGSREWLLEACQVTPMVPS